MRAGEVRSSQPASLLKKEVLRMAAYVLVGGGWLGGWCWQRVAPRLREEGHDAYPVTLTGLGERPGNTLSHQELEEKPRNLARYGDGASAGEIVRLVARIRNHNDKTGVRDLLPAGSK